MLDRIKQLGIFSPKRSRRLEKAVEDVNLTRPIESRIDSLWTSEKNYGFDICCFVSNCTAFLWVHQKIEQTASWKHNRHCSRIRDG